jgi:hypothetical protein
LTGGVDADGEVLLRPSGGLGRGVLRALVLAFCFGAGVAVAGISGSMTGGLGPLDALAWALVVVGGLLCVVSLVLMGLSRRLGRPSVLTPQGVLLPGFPARRHIGWERIDRCEVRRGEGDVPLLAAWLKDERSGASLLWLGALPTGKGAERDVLARIERWRSQT